MGKSGAVWAVVNNAKRSPPGCLGCGKRIFFGERCPPCATEVRTKGSQPQAQAQAMTRTLHRPCLDCGKQVRGKPRCRACSARVDQAKRARRPDLDDHHERERRRRLVADHRATVGDWCPGLEDHPAHPSADLVADHVIEVAISGLATGPLRVLCRSENSRRSARILTNALALHPSPAERDIRLSGDPPAVA